MMPNCLYCGKPFPNPAHGVQKYCSADCKRLARNKRIRERRIPVWPHEIRRCRQCGQDFLAKRPDFVFCSIECHVKWHNTHRIRKNRAIRCPICNKEFVPINKGPVLYCSDECREKARRGYYDRYFIRLHPCANPECTHKTRQKYCWWCRDKMRRKNDRD